MSKSDEYKELYLYERLIAFCGDAKYTNVETINYIIDEIIKEKLSIQENDVLSYDNIDSLLFNKYSEVKNDVTKYVENVISQYKIIDNNLAVSSHIKMKVVATCLTKYSYKDIMSGKLNEIIQQMYFEYLTDIRNTICKQLKMYVDKNIDFKINYYELEEKIVNDVLVSNSLNLDDILDMNDKAKSYIKVNAYNFSLNKKNNYVYTAIDIEQMADNSIAKNDKNDEIKYSPIKKMIPKLLTIVVLISLVLSFIGFGRGISDSINDFRTDIRYSYASNILEDNRYEIIYTKHNENFDKNALSVIVDYDEYIKYGEDYAYLGFYEAYKHVGADRLSIMDDMLIRVKKGTANEELKSNLKQDYFLDFVFNRLVHMNCKEINKAEYNEAVKEYIKVAEMIKNDENYSDKTVMDVLSDRKDVIRCIYEIMDLYDDYSARCYRDLAKEYKDTIRR